MYAAEVKGTAPASPGIKEWTAEVRDVAIVIEAHLERPRVRRGVGADWTGGGRSRRFDAFPPAGIER
jgi:hypothetical protein